VTHYGTKESKVYGTLFGENEYTLEDLFEYYYVSMYETDELPYAFEELDVPTYIDSVDNRGYLVPAALMDMYYVGDHHLCYRITTQANNYNCNIISTKTSRDSYFVGVGGELLHVSQLQQGTSILVCPFPPDGNLSIGVISDVTILPPEEIYGIVLEADVQYYIKDGFVVPSNT